MITLLLLLLGACVRMGLSYDNYQDVQYGNAFRIGLSRRIYSVEFRAHSDSRVRVLWKRDDPQPSEDRRQVVTSDNFYIYKVTQKDSGRYMRKDRDQMVVATVVLDVQARTRHYDRMTDETFHFTFELEQEFCNIYYFRDGYDDSLIILKGRQQSDLDHLGCYWSFESPCGLSSEDLSESCSGRFDVIDNDGNKALEVYLQINSPPVSTSYLGIGGGIVVSALLSCCVRCLCCKKKSKKKGDSDSPADDGDDEPAVHYREYDHEPVGPGQIPLSEPSGTPYAAQPSHASTGPLIHNPPPVDAPPAYSEQVSALASHTDIPAAPLSSDPEPRYEVKWPTFNSATPLGSDSPQSNVYTSDKLNFL